MAPPVFAVVGHPNKGKSSIVATLAQDETVRIAPEPGTTQAARQYPMRVDSRVLYTLVDTPGFQRARSALAWMQQRQTSAAQRPAVVRQFVREFSQTDHFRDECQLLAPILEGAGILYVVDGSRPFGSEYEAEMEILRWTGQPSMALINPIRDEAFVAEWQAALGQYFRIVRVFNAVTAEFRKRLDLLRAFGELKEEWRPPLIEAAARLQDDRLHRHQRAARAMAAMVAEALSLTVSTDVTGEPQVEAAKARLAEEYRQRLRRREQQCRQEIEEIYDHRQIERLEPAFEVLSEDLFSERTWRVFGLSRNQLAVMGATGGALVGGGIDVAVGGTSFLLGTAVGAVMGGAAAWLSVRKLAEIRVGPLPPGLMGGLRVRMGPSRSLNFPYVVLGRAMLHHRLVAQRTHARRDRLAVEGDALGTGWLDRMGSAARRELERQFRRLRRGDEPAAVAEALATALAPAVSACDQTASAGSV